MRQAACGSPDTNISRSQKSISSIVAGRRVMRGTLRRRLGSVPGTAEPNAKQQGGRMLTHEQNERMARVEGDAPMGVLMRESSWVPAALSVQLAPDGPPRRVRLLGRDYVAFRDTNGAVGFLDEGCPHRNASLVLARNEECGLRCIFHGWKVDVTGQVVEAPTHTPNPEAFAAKIQTRRYPTAEGGGMVWVWLGERAAP